jgi:hypothetical protein
MVPDRGGGEIETGGRLKYSEDLDFASNKYMGPKGFFEMACSKNQALVISRHHWKGMQPIFPLAHPSRCLPDNGPAGSLAR